MKKANKPVMTNKLKKAYRKGGLAVLRHMKTHTGKEDGVLYLTKMDWDDCQKFIRDKLLKYK